MDLALIEQLMKLLEQSGLDTLEVSDGPVRIKLSKTPFATASVEVDTAGSASAAKSATKSAKAGDDPANSDTITIRAGLAGTFYRAPSPGAAPFVKTGDRVRDGDKLALIEAMKMLNPVECETDGIVSAIFADDATAVEAGTALFEIEKTAT